MALLDDLSPWIWTGFWVFIVMLLIGVGIFVFMLVVDVIDEWIRKRR